MTKEEILEKIKTVQLKPGRNSMGVSENWHNTYYQLAECFSAEELENMDIKELTNLIKLGEHLSFAFY